MPFMIFFVATLALASQLDANEHFLEDNPELGTYQNIEQCFSGEVTLYMMFRNFEEDRFFGGTSKCVSATQKTAVVRDSVRTSVGYGKTKVPRRLTFHSSAGYTMKNVAREQLLDEPTESFNLTGVYIDCENCHIVRHSYVDEGAGCSYWVPEDKVTEENSCCHFVFDLLCGTHKYQVYDDCLQ
ncbi:uncharacterized protein LOC125946086 [Dermacentor silvarum]|uniref:uncharacterized protein LOC125946086 n=1 Tax=Dermacentor silvarum TaxID=543639 RepID=UPI002100C4B3|nr:uncharacterized protein LOC125946086 [Dermacentor silvarum]